MRTYVLFAAAMLLMISSPSCTEDVPPEPVTTGTLQFGYRMAGQDGFKQKKSEKCELIDVGNQMQYFGVGTKRLVDQANAAEYSWVTLYSNEAPQDLELSYFTQRGDVTFDLDPGSYVANKHIQNNKVVWVLKTPAGDTIYAEDSNTTNCPLDRDSRGFFIEYNDSTGMFTEAGGKIHRCRSGGSEGLGEFEIRAGKTTQVIMRMNISHIEWIDTDSSGNWSDGDKLDNFETFDGSPLMMRYEVKYLD